MLGFGLCKVSARREPQPNLACAKLVQGESNIKIKSQEIFIFIAEPQPNLAYAKLVFFYESIPSCPHFLHTK